MNLRTIVSSGLLMCAGTLLGIALRFYREKHRAYAIKFGSYGLILIVLTAVYFYLSRPAV